MEVNGQFYTPATSTGEGTASTHWIGGWTDSGPVWMRRPRKKYPILAVNRTPVVQVVT